MATLKVQDSHVRAWVHFGMFIDELSTLGLAIEAGELHTTVPYDEDAEEYVEMHYVHVDGIGYIRGEDLTMFGGLGGRFTNNIPGVPNCGRTRIGFHVPMNEFEASSSTQVTARHGIEAPEA